MTFGQYIKALRKQFGKTQKQLGKELGRGQSLVSYWERSGKVPSERIAEVFEEHFNLPKGAIVEACTPKKDVTAYAQAYVEMIRLRPGAPDLSLERLMSPTKDELTAGEIATKKALLKRHGVQT